MIERLEVTPGAGTVIRYGGIVAWADPSASAALISFLAQSARNLSPSPRGGRQIADHIAGVLGSRDPEPHVAFAVIGPSDHGWASLLHGPVQAWDGARWLAPTPTPGWLQAIITPRPAITVSGAGTPTPAPEPDAMWDLEAGVVPGSGFVLIPSGVPGRYATVRPPAEDHLQYQRDVLVPEAGPVPELDGEGNVEAPVEPVVAMTTALPAVEPTQLLGSVVDEPESAESAAPAASGPGSPDAGVGAATVVGAALGAAALRARAGEDKDKSAAESERGASEDAAAAGAGGGVAGSGDATTALAAGAGAAAAGHAVAAGAKRAGEAAEPQGSSGAGEAAGETTGLAADETTGLAADEGSGEAAGVGSAALVDEAASEAQAAEAGAAATEVVPVVGAGGATAEPESGPQADAGPLADEYGDAAGPESGEPATGPVKPESLIGSAAGEADPEADDTTPAGAKPEAVPAAATAAAAAAAAVAAAAGNGGAAAADGQAVAEAGAGSGAEGVEGAAGAETLAAPLAAAAAAAPALEPSAPEPPSPPRRPPVPGPAGSVDLRTVATTAGAPLAKGGGPDQRIPGAPVVAGALCARGHLNRPGLTVCARCRTVLPDGAKEQVSGTRPPLGALVGDDGTIYRLDRGYLVGSAPGRDPTVGGGLARPLVLHGSDVSGSHAELRLADWDVLVVDRGSAAGTCVFEPGASEWARLNPFEPRVLPPGTHVAFGQRVVTFLSPWVTQA